MRIALFVAIPLTLLAAVALFISYSKNDRSAFDTSTWQTYEDTSYGFKLQHPPEWRLEEHPSENQDIEKSYYLIDPINTSLDGKPIPVAQIDISARSYVQMVSRIKADTMASTGETVVKDGIQGARFKSDYGTLQSPIDATLFPLKEKTLVIYMWPGEQNSNYGKALDVVFSSLKLE